MPSPLNKELPSAPISPKPSPLDKELPPMPILCSTVSLELNGTSEMVESTPANLGTPNPRLEPDLAVGNSPASDHCASSIKSPSLRSPINTPGVKVGNAIMMSSHHAQFVDGPGHHSRAPGNNQIDHFDASPSSVNAASYFLLVPGSAERQVREHIAAQQQSGSPTPRQVCSKKNSHDVHELSALSKNGLDHAAEGFLELTPQNQTGYVEGSAVPDTAVDAIGEAEQESPNGKSHDHLSIEDSSSDRSDTPQSFSDTPSRRSAKYGVGPSIRYAKDAHDVIMGKAPSNELLVPRSRTGLVNNIVHDPKQRSNGLNPQRDITPRSKFNQSKNRTRASLPMYDLSLHSSPEHIANLKPEGSGAKKVSFADRLSRPTAASQARSTSSKMTPMNTSSPPVKRPYAPKTSPTAPSSGSKINSKNTAVTVLKSETMPSTKKVGRGSFFKSRLTSYLNGRRRGSDSIISTGEKPTGNKWNTKNGNTVKTSVPTGSREDAASMDRSMNSGATGDNSAYQIGEISGEQSDKLAPSEEATQRDRYEYRALRSQGLHRTQPDQNRGAGGGRRLGASDDGDEDENDPASNGRAAPGAHYTEDARPQVGGNAGVSNAGDPSMPADIDETGMGIWLDEILEECERVLEIIIDTGLAAPPPVREYIATVVACIGNAIEATRCARVNAVKLMRANAELATLANHLAARAARALLAQPNSAVARRWAGAARLARFPTFPGFQDPSRRE